MTQTRYAVRRYVDLDADDFDPFHQFIGIVAEPTPSEVARWRSEASGPEERNAESDPEWSFDSQEDRVRAIIEKAYRESTLDSVKTQDAHKVAKIETECTIDSEMLKAEEAEE